MQIAFELLGLISACLRKSVSGGARLRRCSRQDIIRAKAGAAIDGQHGLTLKEDSSAGA